MRTIVLKSSDNITFEVREAIASQSVVIRELLELKESESSNNGDNIVIPVQNVTGRMLGMVIEWITNHVDGELNEERRLRDWESEFVDVELDLIYELIMAANYLEVNGLFHCACQRVADMIAGKQPEEIRRIFNIENDFSPEEEAELRAQNAWEFNSGGGGSSSSK